MSTKSLNFRTLIWCKDPHTFLYGTRVKIGPLLDAVYGENETEKNMAKQQFFNNEEGLLLCPNCAQLRIGAHVAVCE